MLATQVLTSHHDELRALMADVAGLLDDGVTSDARRDRVTELLNELTDELTMHEMIEDAIFYPAMSDTSTLVSIAHPEHRQISDQLATVLRVRHPASTRLAEEFAALRTAVEQHARMEEQQMFREVDQKVDAGQLERMGDQLAEELHRLRTSRLTRFRLRLKRRVLRHTPTAPWARP